MEGLMSPLSFRARTSHPPNQLESSADKMNESDYVALATAPFRESRLAQAVVVASELR